MEDEQEMPDLLYSLKAFGILPQSVTEEIQDALERELSIAITGMVDAVQSKNCYKVAVDRAQLVHSVLKDIVYYDACIDRIEQRICELMKVPPHVVLPGDEHLREAGSDDVRQRRIEVRRLLAMKLESNAKLRKEIRLLEKRREVEERLKIYSQKLDILHEC